MPEVKRAKTVRTVMTTTAAAAFLLVARPADAWQRSAGGAAPRANVQQTHNVVNNGRGNVGTFNRNFSLNTRVNNGFRGNLGVARTFGNNSATRVDNRVNSHLAGNNFRPNRGIGGNTDFRLGHRGNNGIFFGGINYGFGQRYPRAYGRGWGGWGCYGGGCWLPEYVDNLMWGWNGWPAIFIGGVEYASTVYSPYIVNGAQVVVQGNPMVTYTYDVPGRGAVNVVGPQPQAVDDQSTSQINTLTATQNAQERKIGALAATQAADERKFGSAISMLAENQAKQGKGFQNEIESITKTLRHTADVLGATTSKLKETTDDVKELDRADESEAKGLKTAQRNALIGVSTSLGAVLVSIASLGLHLRKSKKAKTEEAKPAG